MTQVGIVDCNPSLSTLSQRSALALASHASTPRTIVVQASGGLDALLSGDEMAGAKIVAASSAEDLCAKLEAPRCVLLLGAATGKTLRELLPHLQPGDAVVDGGSDPWAASAASEMREEPAEGVHLLRCGFPGARPRRSDGTSIVVSCSAAAWAGGISSLYSLSL